MKIVKFEAANIKKLRAVEITPAGAVVTITGKNAQGKSSILDSIYWALAGTSAIQKQPIRKGQDHAIIKLDLGDIRVERKFSESGSTLIVESMPDKDGNCARYPSPQRMLDALLGELSFDPLVFARAEPKKQAEELRRVAKVEVDLDQLDRLNLTDYQKRTDLNRQAKAKHAQAEGIKVAAETPDAYVDESALADELQQAGEKNSDRELRKAAREASQRKAYDMTTRANELQRQWIELETKIISLRREATNLIKESADLEKSITQAPMLPAPIDLSSIRARMEAAAATNANVRAKKQKEAALAEAVAVEKQAQALTDAMTAREKEKQSAIAQAKMPVAGLGFENGVVTFNGLPFDQASSAEQLRISMAIAMSANPKLRVIRIQDGSLLDGDSLAQVAEMAKASDYQVWLETVSTDRKVGIMIEDGAVIAIDGQPVEQKESETTK